MNHVIFAALTIGGSTLIGTGCGFLLNRIPRHIENAATAFAAGVMLAAAMLGLYQPAIGMTHGAALLLIPLGTAAGVLFLRGIGGLSARLGGAMRTHPELMFVLALALHKFPEGMAGGVGLCGMNPTAARTVVIGIALQNLPEGMVMIPPMLAAGVTKRRAAMIAIATGLLNAAGVFAGALGGAVLGGVLPFALAFAGGAMLDVIVAQMIPQAANKHALIVTGGFVLMACAGALF